MRYGRYSEAGFGDGEVTHGYEAIDGDKVKGQVDITLPRVAGFTQYPTHPAFRPSREAAFGKGPHVTRSMESSGMNGVRGGQADGDYRMQSYDEAWRDNNTQVNQTIPAFLHQSEQIPGKVDYMRTTKGARAVAGPLLGIAIRDQMNQGNGIPVPSDDLSAHSAPLVQHINRNLGTQFPTKKTNELTFDSDTGPLRDTLGMPKSDAEHQFSREESEAGRQFMRRQIRRTRSPAVRDAGYEQMGLFNAQQ